MSKKKRKRRAAELRAAPGPAAEVRADATALAIDAIVRAVSGASVRTWAAGAVEIAARTWAAAMSTATVTEGIPVGAPWLAEVGRDLARRGEVVYLADVTPAGAVRLLRAESRDVDGDSPDPAEWWYRLTLTGPRTTRTVTAPAAQVVHVRYATESHSPGRGVSPLQYAQLTGQLTANLEQSLGYEAGGPIANLITLPEGFNSQRMPEDGSDPDTPLPADTLAAAIRAAKGGTLLPETTRGSYGDRDAAAPKNDMEPARLGPAPPMALVTLRAQVENTVLGIFGIGPSLGPMGISDGTMARETARRLWSLTVQPLGALIAAELTRVLERPVSLDFSRPSGAADVAARARAVSALTKTGMSTEDALWLTGWRD